MTTPAQPNPATQRLVLWTIWFALFASVFIYRHYLIKPGPGRDSFDGTVDPLMIFLLFGPMAVSLFARITLVPRARHSGQLLVAMIIGLAAAESLTFFGIFLYRSYESLFIGVSLGLMLLFVPAFLPDVPRSPRRD